jgi:hypothetical protein
MRLSVPVLVALLLIGSVGVVVSTAQSSEYSLSSPNEIEIPARDLTVNGENYTVRSVGRVTPGETIRVDVSAPENADYSVYLFDESRRIVNTDTMTGSGRATFSTGTLSPGSYLAAVYDEEILAVYPVVLQGYDLTLDAPATSNDGVTVNITVNDGALAREPPVVQLVFGTDSRTVRIDATRVTDGEYQASVPTDRFELSTFPLYGVVRGEQRTEDGNQVILAISDRHEVQLTAPSTPTPTNTPADGGNGGGSGGQVGDRSEGEVELRSAELLNRTVVADEAANVRVSLANADPLRGHIVLNLTANGENVIENRVAVAASSERTVHIQTAFDSPGKYNLSINGHALGTLTVTEVTTSPTADLTTPTPTPTSTPTPTPEEVVTPRPTTTASTPTTTSGNGAGFGAAAAVVSCVLALVVLSRRQ